MCGWTGKKILCDEVFICHLLFEKVMIFIIFSPSFIPLNCFIFGAFHFQTGISTQWNSFCALLFSTSIFIDVSAFELPPSQFPLALLFLLPEWYCAVLEHFSCRALGSIHNSKCIHREAVAQNLILNLLTISRSPGDALAIAKEWENSAGFHGLRFSSEDQDLKFSQHCYSFLLTMSYNRSCYHFGKVLDYFGSN